MVVGEFYVLSIRLFWKKLEPVKFFWPVEREAE